VTQPTTLDQKFARYCAGGDPTLLGDVYDGLAPRLLRDARRLLPGCDPEDVVHRTFLQAIQVRSQFAHPGLALPWLRGIMANQIHKQVRENSRIPDLNIDVDRVAGCSDDPIASASCREVEQAIQDASYVLDNGSAEVLLLRLQGFGSKEIATRVCRPSGTVRTQLARAMSFVRRFLPDVFRPTRCRDDELGPSPGRTKHEDTAVDFGCCPGSPRASTADRRSPKQVRGLVLACAGGLLVGAIAGGVCGYSMGLAAQPVVSASAELKPAVPVAEDELKTSGDAELDYWRKVALNAPLDELFEKAGMFLYVRVTDYPRDEILWSGVERLARELVENSRRIIDEGPMLMIIGQIEGPARPAEPSLRDLVSALRSKHKEMMRKR
jgi:RNA polymerase sigma factor (sigma-70 family)